MRLFDSHAHLANEQLEPRLPDLIARAQRAGLVGILSIGTDATDSRRCLEIADRYPSVWASAGIHPNGCHTATDRDWEQVVELSRQPNVVALGETGLDRYWDDSPWATQVDWFRRHLELSRQTQLPLVIHMRDCTAEMREVLRDFSQGNPIRGVMHSYTGDAAAADDFLEMGLHISFAGMVTFTKSAALQEVARRVPLNRLLIETDSPYLTPHPFRSQRPNEPFRVAVTCQAIAALRQMDGPALAEQTTVNALRLFGLQDPLADSPPT